MKKARSAKKRTGRKREETNLRPLLFECFCDAFLSVFGKKAMKPLCNALLPQQPVGQLNDARRGQDAVAEEAIGVEAERVAVSTADPLRGI